MSGLAATRRSAAWRRTSSQLRMARGGGSLAPSLATSGDGLTVSSGAGLGAAVGGTGLVTSPGPRSDEPVQPATASSTARPGVASRPRRRLQAESMKGTIDFLGEFSRNAFDGGEVFDAGMAHAARAAEALQEFRPLLRADPVNFLQPAGAGAHAGTAGAHSGDREAVRLVADLRHQHQRRRLAAERDLRPAVGEHQLLEPDLAPFALLHADDPGQLDAQLLEHLA